MLIANLHLYTNAGITVCIVILHRNSDKGVEIAYLGTRTGLSRINLFVVPDELTNQ